MRRAGTSLAAACGLFAVLGLVGCHAEGPELAASSATAAPDPAAPEPAAPDPAAPDPAAPDPSAAPPAASEPSPGGGSLEESGVESVLGSLTGDDAPDSPVARACDSVVESLTDAVARYEVAALAEGGGAGDRLSAAAEMLVAVEQARREAGTQAAAGLPGAAGPAVAAVLELHDGLGTRAVLDEDDAAGWRAARDRLESWCASRA